MTEMSTNLHRLLELVTDAGEPENDKERADLELFRARLAIPPVGDLFTPEHARLLHAEAEQRAFKRSKPPSFDILQRRDAAAAVFPLLPARLIITAACLLIAFMLYGVLFFLRDAKPSGCLTMKIDQPDATVYVDGKEHFADKSGRITITLQPGMHRVKAVKNGFETPTESVLVKSNETTLMPIRLLPTPAKVVLAKSVPEPSGLPLPVEGTPPSTIDKPLNVHSQPRSQPPRG